MMSPHQPGRVKEAAGSLPIVMNLMALKAPAAACPP